MIQKFNFEKKSLIPGVLILKSKYHYGFNKRKIPYYLFKPITKDLPDFLVAFSNALKYKNNIYINIKFKIWEIKIPYGTCENVIGEIDNDKSEYEFLLYKNNVFKKTFKLDKSIFKLLKNKSLLDIFENEAKSYKKINNLNIISIDPINCKDIDDALSYQKINDKHKIGIHIADPTLFIKKFNLLNKIDDRISSIYCQHRKINMLPNILSDNYISLLENKLRFSLTLWITLDNNFNILNYKYEKCLIKVNKNYSYDEFDEIYKNNDYLLNLFEISKNISKNLNFFEINNWDSHKMIEIYMLLANNLTAKFINKNYNFNILRTHNNDKNIFKNLDNYNLNNDLKNFLNIYQSSSAEYKFINKKENTDNNYYHYALNLKYYTHFTSPIRRLIDNYIHIIIKSIIDKESYISFENLERICDNVNNFNKNLKKMYKDSNKIDIFFNKNFNIYDAYVINIEYNNLKIYIPKLKYLQNVKLFDEKLLNILNINNTNLKIEINNENITETINIYDKIKVQIYSKSNQTFMIKKINIKILKLDNLIN